jgi:hypothetical protein
MHTHTHTSPSPSSLFHPFCSWMYLVCVCGVTASPKTTDVHRAHEERHFFIHTLFVCVFALFPHTHTHTHPPTYLLPDTVPPTREFCLSDYIHLYVCVCVCVCVCHQKGLRVCIETDWRVHISLQEFIHMMSFWYCDTHTHTHTHTPGKKCTHTHTHSHIPPKTHTHISTHAHIDISIASVCVSVCVCR